MAEDISVKILTQTSENIQRLFDLTTRIDERVKSVQGQQDNLNARIENMVSEMNSITKQVAVLESMDDGAAMANLSGQLEEVRKQIIEMDKRVAVVEGLSGQQQDRWKNITGFIIQLVWIVIASWLLYKMNLNPPPVP